MTALDGRHDDAVVAELDSLLTSFAARHPGADQAPLRAAYELAHSKHSGQMRKSGEPFINHPLTVAMILADYGMDASTIVAALLHDTVEDTDLTLDELREQFGDEVAALTDGVTKLDRLDFGSREEQQAATIRKMVVAMAADVRVLLIKLADRLHNVRTLWALDPKKQERVARETLEIYAPLAHRLGVQEIKHEMEDRCFAILYPKRNAEISELLIKRAPQREAFIEKAVLAVDNALSEHSIVAETTGRPKHPYSIYRKMIEGGSSFDAIHDLIGIRIVVDDVRECYAALGAVHTLWAPIQGRFKDYIAMPKFNLYQSLHTTVVGPDGKPLEVQIRTKEMDERAEFGIAAHWRYKEAADDEDLRWISDIRFLQDEYPDPSEFLTHLKIDLYQDEVFVLTPGGDVISLPKGSTPVDFAYSIHTDVGHACVGAKVNGRLVPLSTELDSGDIVEVMTSKSPDAHPSRDWLRFVSSSRAAAKIRQWFSRERRQESLAKGREAVAEALRREGLGLSANERDKALEAVATKMSYADPEALFVAIGDGKAAVEGVVSRVVRIVRPKTEEKPAEPALAVVQRRSSGGIVVEGLDDMLVNIARCCVPVPGDPVVGFVTVGRGVSVHRADCTNIAALGEKTERMIEVRWDASTAGSFTVWLQVEALDRPKLLRDVTAVIGDHGANIVASSSASDADRVAILRYEVELGDVDQLERLLAELRGIDGVLDAYRLVPSRGD